MDFQNFGKDSILAEFDLKRSFWKFVKQFTWRCLTRLKYGTARKREKQSNSNHCPRQSFHKWADVPGNQWCGWNAPRTWGAGKAIERRRSLWGVAVPYLSHSAWEGFEIKASIFKSIDWAQCNHFLMIYYIKLQDPPYPCFALSLWRSISCPTQWGSCLSNGFPVSALSTAANDSPWLTQGKMEMEFGTHPWTPLAGDDGGWNFSKSRPRGRIPAEWSWITW